MLLRVVGRARNSCGKPSWIALAPALAAGISPGSGPSRGEQEWDGLVREWFPERADTRLRQVTRPGFPTRIPKSAVGAWAAHKTRQVLRLPPQESHGRNGTPEWQSFSISSNYFFELESR